MTIEAPIHSMQESVDRSKFDLYLEKYQSIFNSKTPDELRTLAHIKRFLERFTGDLDFRSGVMSGLFDLELAARSIGCDTDLVDFLSLRPIFHPEFADQRTPELIAQWPSAKIWSDYISGMISLRTDMLLAGDSAGKNLAFDKWRARQINRSSCDLGIAGSGLVHPPVAFEVSSGCSVGCWFCGISAERFRGHFALANGGAEEWKAILSEVNSVIGEALRSSFLYWATEPLDNPDYLGILDIYYDTTHVFPQTTSAIPLRNIELTRGVLSRWSHGGGYPNRFSILNTKTLLGVHKQFTPEELLGVELVLQNSGNAANNKTDAGKAIEIKPITGPKNSVKKGFAMMRGTIACVTGFLINIVEKTVKLVSPCMPTSDVPNGYIIYASAQYTDPADLGRVLRKMIEEQMPTDLDPGRPISFSHNLKYSPGVTGGGSVEGSAMRIEAPMVDLFGKYLTQGPQTPLEVLKRALADGHKPFAVVNAIEKCRHAGLIDVIAGL